MQPVKIIFIMLILNLHPNAMQQADNGMFTFEQTSVWKYLEFTNTSMTPVVALNFNIYHYQTSWTIWFTLQNKIKDDKNDG